ncbi:MAG: urea ABC transporter permease subunit UrtB, partial [Rhodocyclaceae bacterium]|nr:urea ABC transporter permease subunit UrtB [Rhodocyclaceae bacterium]
MRRILLPALILLLTIAAPVRAALDPALLQGFVDDDFGAKLEAIARLGEIGDEDARRVLGALADESLMVAGERVLIFDGENVLDAATGEVLADYPDNMDQVMVNNRLRVAIEAARSAMELFSPERARRLAAAKVLRERGDASKLPLLQKALEREKDSDVGAVLELAAARVQLGSAEPIERLKAAEALSESSDQAVINLLRARLEPEVEGDDAVRAAVKGSLASIERRLAMAQATGTLFTGLSLGSILLLAALGLAITYGVMGVINMAHGELLMVGAYATYVVQGQFASHWPAMADNYLLAAIPVSFFVAAAVGVLMERTVIRFLYGRPLESLLATWGLSLVLIQTA